MGRMARRAEALLGGAAGAAGVAALVFDLVGPVYQARNQGPGGQVDGQGLLAAGLAPAASAFVVVVGALCLALAGASLADARHSSGRALALVWGSDLLLLGAAGLSAASIGPTLLPAAALGLLAAASASVGRTARRG